MTTLQFKKYFPLNPEHWVELYASEILTDIIGFIPLFKTITIEKYEEFVARFNKEITLKSSYSNFKMFKIYTKYGNMFKLEINTKLDIVFVIGVIHVKEIDPVLFFTFDDTLLGRVSSITVNEVTKIVSELDLDKIYGKKENSICLVHSLNRHLN